jgi:cation transport regulator
MPNSSTKESDKKRSTKAGNGKRRSTQLSARTEKQIDSLPAHAKRIYKRVHDNAIEQYQNPEKRRGGEKQSAEEVAHKAAWAAVKRDYTKKGDKWIKK